MNFWHHFSNLQIKYKCQGSIGLHILTLLLFVNNFTCHTCTAFHLKVLPLQSKNNYCTNIKDDIIVDCGWSDHYCTEEYLTVTHYVLEALGFHHWWRNFGEIGDDLLLFLAISVKVVTPQSLVSVSKVDSKCILIDFFFIFFFQVHF